MCFERLWLRRLCMSTSKVSLDISDLKYQKKSTAWWLQTRESCDARPARGQIIWTDWNSTWAYLERVREIGIIWNHYEFKNMLVYFVHSSNHFRTLKKSLDFFSRHFGCHCFPCPWKPISNTIKQHLQCEEHVVGFSFSPDGLLLGNSMRPEVFYDNTAQFKWHSVLLFRLLLAKGLIPLWRTRAARVWFFSLAAFQKKNACIDSVI